MYVLVILYSGYFIYKTYIEKTMSHVIVSLIKLITSSLKSPKMPTGRQLLTPPGGMSLAWMNATTPGTLWTVQQRWLVYKSIRL